MSSSLSFQMENWRSGQFTEPHMWLEQNLDLNSYLPDSKESPIVPGSTYAEPGQWHIVTAFSPDWEM